MSKYYILLEPPYMPCCFSDISFQSFVYASVELVKLGHPTTQLHSMDSLKEIVSFMNINSRLDLKAVSVSHVLGKVGRKFKRSMFAQIIVLWFIGLTGSPDGRSLIYKCPEVVEVLLKLTADKEGTIAKDALLAVVNISADEDGAKMILDKVQ